MSGKEHDDGLDASFIISQAKSRNRPLHPYTPEKEEEASALSEPSGEAASSSATKEEGRRRRGKGQDYERLFIRNAPSNTRSGKTVYIRKEFHERITRIVQVIGKNELSLYSYLDNVLEQHFATYQEEISELYKKRNSDIFSYEPNIYNLLKQSIMSDKAIILSVILAAVLCVAVPFIFRVCRYRRRMKTLIVPDGPSGEVAVGTVPTPEAEYLARYICLLRLPFAGNKHVKIRPSYHERIREITRVIGRGDVTITAYVDKVLKAHLDDNRETIERLFEEREAVASRQPKAEER